MFVLKCIDRRFWCLYGVLPGLTDRVHRGLYGVLLGACMESYQGLLTDLSSVCMDCYWVLLQGLTRVYWPTFQMFVEGVTGSYYGVLPEAIGQPFRGLYALLSGLVGCLIGVSLGDLPGCYLAYWPTFQVFVWSVTEHAEGIVVRFSTNWVRFSLARFCTDWVRFSSHTTEACPKHHSKCVQTNAYHYSTLHTTGEQTQDTSSLPWRLQTISIISLFYLSKFFLQYSFFLSSFFNLLSSTSLPL